MGFELISLIQGIHFLISKNKAVFKCLIELGWALPCWDALAVKSTSMNYAISKSFILSVNLSKLLELKLKAVNQIDVWYSRIIWALLFGELCWIFCFVFSFCSFCSYPLNRKHNAENIREESGQKTYAIYKYHRAGM